LKECPFCTFCFEDETMLCPNDGNKLVFSMPGSQMILDKYRLEALIGRGRMGKVYRATQVILKREVAVKVLSTQFFHNPTAVGRFRTEALAVAKLDHPNIIKLYDYGTLPMGGAYMAMKLLKGHPLAQEMAFVRPMPFMRILRVMQSICAGISVAHENHVVHCDLRPDNIMLENVDGQELIQIVDFGIAQLREISNSGTLYSVHTGAAEGAPSYMSPEQCLGEKLYYTSDIYSLGVMLYEMLTGVVPFDSPIGADVALQHIKTPPPLASQRRSYVTPELDQIVTKAMAKLPKHRFQSAREFFESLEIALKASEEIFLEAMEKAKRPIKPTMGLDKNTNPLDPEMLKLIRGSVEKSERGSAVTSPLISPPFKVPEPVTKTEPEFSKITVLVVDDDTDILEVFSTIFEGIGANLITATDGEEGWKKAKQFNPHLIISDIIMPKVDGWQFFFRCKIDPVLSERPFIFITGRDIEEEKVVALEQNAEDYWIKPFVVLEITVRLKRLLKRISKNLP
jgi:serine/threonine protein kinase